MRCTTLTTLAALATLTTTASPLLVAGPAQAAATCQGRVATIQSTGGGTVTGTEGDDVILVTGTATVNALGGNDTICVAGGTLDAGAGDDSVLVSDTGDDLSQDAVLGAGHNSYSSPGRMEDDVVSGVAGQPDTDVISTGPDRDSVDVTLPSGSHPTLDGGATAFDTLRLSGEPGESGAWDVDLATGAVTRAGVSRAAFSGFQILAADLGPAASVAVHGTPGPDRVGLGSGTVDVDLGAGNDGVTWDYLSPAPTAGRIDLGSGQDFLSLGGRKRVDLDLRAGRWDDVAVSGVEVSLLGARRVQYVGTSGADEAYAIGCRVTMRGGAGADTLSYATDEHQPVYPHCSAYRYDLRGQAGRDHLTGWNDSDVLLGGRGSDVADGKRGSDRCVAERERRCER